MRTLHGVRVVLWAEEPSELGRVETTLRRAGCDVCWVSSLKQLETRVRKKLTDLVVVRPYQDGLDASESLGWIRKIPSPTGVLVACGPLDVRLYLDAMEAGALDAVVLPPDEDEVIRVVSQALETASISSGETGLECQLPKPQGLEVRTG